MPAGPQHYASRRFSFMNMGFHPVHIRSDMAVEKPMSFAKDIQSGFTVFGPAEAVLRALAVARKEPFAFEAFLRKTVALAYAEADLLRRGHEFFQRGLKHIADAVLRIYEMVARVEVAVMLDDGIAAAGLGIYAYARLHSAPARKGCIKLAHEETAHIVAYPMIEDITQETAVFR